MRGGGLEPPRLAAPDPKSFIHADAPRYKSAFRAIYQDFRIQRRGRTATSRQHLPAKPPQSATVREFHLLDYQLSSTATRRDRRVGGSMREVRL